jgi:hypothetical protein
MRLFRCSSYFNDFGNAGTPFAIGRHKPRVEAVRQVRAAQQCIRILGSIGAAFGADDVAQEPFRAFGVVERHRNSPLDQSWRSWRHDRAQFEPSARSIQSKLVAI